MLRYCFYAFSLVLTLAACKAKQPAAEPTALYQGQEMDMGKVLETIALGSCNKQDSPQGVWTAIARQRPDLWIWLGDNIYGDTRDKVVMEDKYRQQKFGKEYTALRRRTPVIGTWDDHDYGVNDGGRYYPERDVSQQLMLDFLDVSQDAPARGRPGVYQSYTFGPAGKQVKVILLDARYFRDSLYRDPAGGNRRYAPNPNGDILGEAQWDWLEKELTNSQAQVHLIGSGIQIIPEEHGFEKWANLPQARQRLFDLLTTTKPAHTLLLSGDRHIAEVSKLDLAGLPYPLYEFTSSGMTHTWSGDFAHEEPNRYRVGKLIIAKNYGILQIDWSGAAPKVTIEIRRDNGDLLAEHAVRWK